MHNGLDFGTLVPATRRAAYVMDATHLTNRDS